MELIRFPIDAVDTHRPQPKVNFSSNALSIIDIATAVVQPKSFYSITLPDSILRYEKDESKKWIFIKISILKQKIIFFVNLAKTLQYFVYKKTNSSVKRLSNSTPALSIASLNILKLYCEQLA